PHATYTLDATPKHARRLVPPEAFLRAYLTWFGGLAPLEMQRRAHGDLFAEWKDYLAALGVPDYHIDIPRARQGNTIMAATVDRLAETLCVRAAEHDLDGNHPMDQRLIFKLEAVAPRDVGEFAPGFDVLHRTFLSYPAALAPTGRTDNFFTLYQQVL